MLAHRCRAVESLESGGIHRLVHTLRCLRINQDLVVGLQLGEGKYLERLDLPID